MHNPLRQTILMLLCGGLAVLVEAPAARAHLLVFKDGFILQGTTKRGSQPLVDPSGARFPIPSAAGFYTVDDGVRSIIFPPLQLQEVLRDDASRSVKPITLLGWQPRSIGTALPSPWTVEKADPWNKWSRTIRLDTAKGRIDIPQHVTVLTPQKVRMDARGMDWVAYYKTRELGPEMVRTLLDQYFAGTSENEKDKRLGTIRFLIQSSYADEAEAELNRLVKDFPDQKDKAEPLLKTVKEIQATDFIEGMERARKVGQYEEVRDRLAQIIARQGLMPFTREKLLVQLQDLRNKQQETDEKLKGARQFLKEFTLRIPVERRRFFSEATEAIAKELNADTLARLELFLGPAGTHERELKQGRTPSQGADELLALAISSWVLGEGGGETTVPAARRLWLTRNFLLEYLKTDDGLHRLRLLEAYQRAEPVGLDEVARLIRFLPPVDPYEPINTKPLRLAINDPAGIKGTYLVQLPPEYHHYRPYPVLFVLHQGDEKPLDMLNRWSDLAAQHGYILVAPEWNDGVRPTYAYSAQEHVTVVSALRDLRRRFQVDSDRVFLFGYGQGGQMAYDVGLSHPDLFAGVLPMSASPIYFPSKYGTNAQFLPFYVVNGDRTGTAATESRTLFKEWVRWNYASFYVEYRGRGVEWFAAELPIMFDWMNRKKRAHPLRELGRVNFNGGAGEEFKAMRLTDNRFYWLEAELQPRHVNYVPNWSKHLAPATLQANIFAGNLIHVRTKGANQVTVWLGPSMIDFNKPVTLRVNGQQLRPVRVEPKLEILLEDVYHRGDRQRPYFARVSAKF